LSNCIKRTQYERGRKYVYEYYKYVHGYLVAVSGTHPTRPSTLCMQIKNTKGERQKIRMRILQMRTRLLSTGEYTPNTSQYRVYRCTIADYLVILDDFYQEGCTCTEYLYEYQRVGCTCIDWVPLNVVHRFCLPYTSTM